MAATLGGLYVTLGLNSAQFTAGLAAATATLRTTAASMTTIGNKMAGIGAGMTLAITTPFVAFAAASSKAAVEASNALGKVQNALTQTGNRAGFTAKQFSAMAEGLMNNSLFDDDDIMKDVTAGLLRFGNISGEVFTRAQQLAVDYAQFMDVDLSTAATAIGKALNNPAGASGAMKKLGVNLTDSQKTLVKSMIATGNAAGAQAYLMGLLETSYGGAAKAAQDADPYNKLSDSLNTLSENVGAIVNNYLVPFLDKLANLAARFNDLSPAMQTTIVTTAAFAAALGPVVATIGGFLTAGSAIITTVMGIGPAMMAATGATTFFGAALAGLKIAGAFLMGPWGLALLAIGAAVAGTMYLVRRASADEREAIEALNTSTDAYTEAAEAAVVATGKDVKAKREAAAAARAEAIENRNGAAEKLSSARASLALARAQAIALRSQPGLALIGNIRQKIMEDRVATLAREVAEGDKAIAAADRRLAAPPPLRSNLGGDGEGGGGGGGGKSASDLAREAEQRRRALEDYNAELDLQEAQLKGDQDRVQVLERQAAVRQRTRNLIDSEINKDKDAAAAEAERAQVRLDAAEEEARIRNDGVARREWEQRLWQIDERGDMVAKAERQALIEERIAFWQGKGRDLITATSTAMSEIAEWDLARVEAAERIAKANALDLEIQRARLRGDNRAERRLSRQADIDDRAKDYQTRAINPLAPGAARAQAEADVASLDQAELQGHYRDFVKDGFKAAMDGDLAGFAQSWIKDWAGKGLEESLNNLGDLLMKLFSNIDWGKGPAGLGGGGINLGSIGKSIGSIFGKIPGFATGGSFKVGGSGSVDSKLVSMRLTPGEMVDVRRPGQLQAANNNSPMHFDLRGAVMTSDLLSQMQGMASQSGGNALKTARTAVPADRKKSDKYSLGRR